MKNKIFIIILLLSSSAFCNDDDVVLTKIEKTLDAIKFHGAHEIETTWGKGKLLITGFVKNDEDRNAVEAELKRVDGVTEIRNNLVVKEEGTSVTEDVSGATKLEQDIQAAVKKLSLKPYDITVAEAPSGVVTVGGKSSTREEGDIIINTIKDVNGVKDVINTMKVLPSISDKAVLNSINKVLEDHQNVDSSPLSFSVINRIVTVTGAVKEHRQIDHVLSLILMVDGVKDIVSKVKVG